MPPWTDSVQGMERRSRRLWRNRKRSCCRCSSLASLAGTPLEASAFCAPTFVRRLKAFFRPVRKILTDPGTCPRNGQVTNRRLPPSPPPPATMVANCCLSTSVVTNSIFVVKAACAAATFLGGFDFRTGQERSTIRDNQRRGLPHREFDAACGICVSRVCW